MAEALGGSDISKMRIMKLEEVEHLGICCGNLSYYSPATQKSFVLLRAGEYILPSFITKYRERGFKSFYYDSQINEDEILKWTQMWKRFQEASNEFEGHQIKDEIMQMFRDCLIEGKHHGSLLAYVNATNAVFGGLNIDYISDYASKEYTLLKRSLIVASMAIPLVVSLGYIDFSFIKDLYNTILQLDYSFAGKKFTLNVKNALELEGQESGLGLKYLQEKSPREVISFTGTVEAAADEIKAYTCSNSQVASLIQIYRASLSTKMHSAEMIDWVAAVIFIDRMVSFNDFDFKPNDGAGYLGSLIKKNWNDRFLQSYGFKKIRTALVDYWELKLEISKGVA